MELTLFSDWKHHTIFRIPKLKVKSQKSYVQGVRLYLFLFGYLLKCLRGHLGTVINIYKVDLWGTVHDWFPTFTGGRILSADTIKYIVTGEVHNFSINFFCTCTDVRHSLHVYGFWLQCVFTTIFQSSKSWRNQVDVPLCTENDAIVFLTIHSTASYLYFRTFSANFSHPSTHVNAAHTHTTAGWHIVNKTLHSPTSLLKIHVLLCDKFR